MPLNITFLGHAGFIFDDGSKRIAVDPFLTDNPVAVQSPHEIAVDYVALSHGHPDHFGDTMAIVTNNRCPVIAPFEICNYVQEQGHDQVEPANPGGRVHTDFGYVAFTPAIHSSNYEGRYMGAACGLVLKFREADITVYHTGDTALFSDMKLIGELAKPDVMCVCIGDRFTMSPELATMAAEWVGPKVAVPIHFKTWPLLAQTADEFTPQGIEVREMQPGETWEYGG